MSLDRTQIQAALVEILPTTTLEAIESERRTRHSTVYICRTSHPSYPVVALKHDPIRGGNAVEANFIGLKRYRSCFASAGLQEVDAPEPLGFLRDPPTVLTTFAPGADFHILLRSLIANSGGEDYVRAAELCGFALAALHSERIDESPGRVLQWPARQLRLSTEWVDSWKSEVRVVHSAGDFAPNNVRVAESGIFVLDPPEELRPTTAHADIAFFLVELLKQLTGRAPIGRQGYGIRLYGQLALSFVRGYGKASDLDPLRPPTRDLISWFAAARASRAASKTMSPGYSKRVREAFLLARWALITRTSIRNAPWLPRE